MNSVLYENISDILSSEELGAVLQAQTILFEKFVCMVRSPNDPGIFNDLLRKAIEVSIHLTGADHGSLILLDSDGGIVGQIISPGEISQEQSSLFIESEVKRGIAGWVMHQQKIGMVNDTISDDRWLSLPNQPYTTRSALAVPIISGDLLLGILTLKHKMPDHFTQKLVELMKTTTTHVAMILENTFLFNKSNNLLQAQGGANKEREAYSRALDQELEDCRQIQMNFLPKQLPQLPNWNIEEFFFPARRVSGDFYDAFNLPGGYTGWVIGDVCDKGVGSALFMALYRSLIRIFSGHAQLSRSLIDTKSQTVGGLSDSVSIRKYNQIDSIRAVALTNDYIAQNNEMCIFATLFFAILDPISGMLVYINGGHETVFVIDRNGIKQTLLPTGPAVGFFPNATFKYKQIQLNPGEILFACTDGVVDALSPNEEPFTKKRLCSLLSQPVANAMELMQRIGTALFAHIGKAPQEDDITMLTLQRKNE